MERALLLLLLKSEKCRLFLPSLREMAAVCYMHVSVSVVAMAGDGTCSPLLVPEAVWFLGWRWSATVALYAVLHY